jgi:hypothetical protein
MKTISGSILILAAAVIFQPAIVNFAKADEAMVFVAPIFIMGVALLGIGLKTRS